MEGGAVVENIQGVVAGKEGEIDSEDVRGKCQVGQNDCRRFRYFV